MRLFPLLALAAPIGVSAIREVKKGVVRLDVYNWDKFLDGSRPYLVKIDAELAHGIEEDIWKKFAEKLAKTKTKGSLVLCEVGVQSVGEGAGRGDKFNERLAWRYGIETKPKKKKKKDDPDIYTDYPVVFYFPRGAKDLDKDFKKFEGDFTENGLIGFLEDNGLKVDFKKGVVSTFDEFAARFVAGDEQGAIEAAEAAVAATPEDSVELKSHQTYLSIMNKMKGKGQDYVDKEQERLEKQLAKRLTKGKRSELRLRYFVLPSFRPAAAEHAYADDDDFEDKDAEDEEEL